MLLPPRALVLVPVGPQCFPTLVTDIDAHDRQMAALSTWGEAIVAAATGDAARMRQLLAGDLDDGLGVNLRTFRTSGHDVLFMTEARNRTCALSPNALSPDALSSSEEASRAATRAYSRDRSKLYTHRDRRRARPLRCSDGSYRGTNEQAHSQAASQTTTGGTLGLDIRAALACRPGARFHGIELRSRRRWARRRPGSSQPAA